MVVVAVDSPTAGAVVAATVGAAANPAAVPNDSVGAAVAAAAVVVAVPPNEIPAGAAAGAGAAAVAAAAGVVVAAAPGAPKEKPAVAAPGVDRENLIKPTVPCLLLGRIKSYRQKRPITKHGGAETHPLVPVRYT